MNILIFRERCSGQTAAQSGSHYRYSIADLAVDGDTSPEMKEGGSCVHPDAHKTAAPEDRNEPAWWRVDLGASYDVYEVKIHNRDSFQCKARLFYLLDYVT